MNPAKHRFNRSQKDKENIKPPSNRKQSVVFKSVARNPLSNLSDNVTNCTTTEIIHNKEAKSGSTDEGERRPRYYLRSHKHLNVNENVDVEKKRIGGTADNKQSMCFQEKKTEVLQTLSETANSKVQKVTKLNSQSKRTKNLKQVNRKKKNVQFSVSETANSLYDMDYFSYMVGMEEKFVFAKDYLVKFIDHNSRLIVVSWLIHVQRILDLPEPTLFSAIRMFDKFLTIIKIPCKTYVLVGVASIWIANKVFGSHLKEVSQFVAFGEGKFSKQEVILMEKQILKTLEFQVNFPEPSTFLHFYIKRMKLECEEIIWFGAMFLLETFTLLFEFSSSAPSLLASTALYLTLLKYNFNHDLFLKFIDKYLMEEQIFKKYASRMEALLKEMLKCTIATHEVVEKYSVEDKFKVAQDFISL